jgi:ABC-type transporter Mla subunit MlaD
MQVTTQNLEQQITGLVDRADKILDEEVRDTLAAVQQSNRVIEDAAMQVNATAQTLDDQLVETLAVIREASETVRELALETQKFIRVLNDEAEDLPGTTNRVNDTMSEAQQLVNEIRSHWLLRRYREEPTPSRQMDPTAIRGGISR